MVYPLVVIGVCSRPNAETFGRALVPAGGLRAGPNGPAAAQVNVLVSPPAPAKVQLLELSVLPGYRPWVLLAKKVEVALLVGSPYGLREKATLLGEKKIPYPARITVLLSSA